jgi:hypothetical protein
MELPKFSTFLFRHVRNLVFLVISIPYLVSGNVTQDEFPRIDPFQNIAQGLPIQPANFGRMGKADVLAMPRRAERTEDGL